MTIAAHVFVGCLRRAVFPLLGALAIAGLGLTTTAPDATTPSGGGTAGLWLHLPGLVVTTVVLAAALEEWPLVARERPGWRHVRRLAHGPLAGCGAAFAGALTALAMALAFTAFAMVALLAAFGGGVPDAAEHRVLPPATAAASTHGLLEPSATAEYATANALPVSGLILRVVCYGPGTGTLEVRRNGELLPGGRLDVGGRITMQRFAFAPAAAAAASGALGRLTITRVDDADDVLVQLADDAVELVLGGRRTGLANALLAAWSHLVPALWIAALLCAGRGRLATPLAIGAATGILLAVTATGWSPHARAVTAFAAGRWLPSEPGLMTAIVTSLAVGAVILLVAAGLGAGRRSR